MKGLKMSNTKPVTIRVTPLQAQYLYSTLMRIVADTRDELEECEHKLLLINEMYFTKKEIRTTKQILKKIKESLK
jgi:hypothetical protein